MKQVLVRMPPDAKAEAGGGLDRESRGTGEAQEGQPNSAASVEPSGARAPEVATPAGANASMPPTSVDFRADLQLLERESAAPWQGRLIEDLMGSDANRPAYGRARPPRKPAARPRAIDPRLWRIIDAWPSLPRAIRQQMLALIGCAGQAPRPRAVARPEPVDPRPGQKSADKPPSKASSGERRRRSRRSAGD